MEHNRHLSAALTNLTVLVHASDQSSSLNTPFHSVSSIAMIGTSGQPYWLAEACKLLLLLQPSAVCLVCLD